MEQNKADIPDELTRDMLHELYRGHLTEYDIVRRKQDGWKELDVAQRLQEYMGIGYIENVGSGHRPLYRMSREGKRWFEIKTLEHFSFKPGPASPPARSA